MTDRRRRIAIDDQRFLLVATIEEGQNLSFYAGQMIAVEKTDMRPGGTEFDFDVHSRPTRGGVAENIMTNRTSLRDEFIERRVKTNVRGLLISPGNAVAVLRGKAPPELTYGELQPQVFRSRHRTDPVAWTINFRRAWYAGQGSKTVRRPPQAQWATVAQKAGRQANGSASAGAHGNAGPAPGQADGGVGLPTLDAILRLYVREADLTRYRPSPRPFGTGDMIFDQPGIFQRLGNMLGIGG